MTAPYGEDAQGTGSHGSHGSHDEAVGSVAEEAARLFSALQGAAASHGFDWGEGRRTGPEGDPPPAVPHECTVCPVCRGLRLLRQVDPAVYGHLADAAESFAAALRELVAAPSRRPERGHGVEHIDIG